MNIIKNQTENPQGKKKFYIRHLFADLVLIVLIILAFPVHRFGDRRIMFFAPARMVTWSLGERDRAFYSGWALRSHLLETEFGEIKIRHSTRVLFRRHHTWWVLDIDERMFETGRASHNLVIEGIQIPSNVSITFQASTGRISFLSLSRHQAREEINISNIPFNVNLIHTIPSEPVRYFV